MSRCLAHSRHTFRHDVIHVDEVTDGYAVSERVSITTLCDDLTEGIQAYAQQQREYGNSLVYSAFDGDLSNWLLNCFS